MDNATWNINCDHHVGEFLDSPTIGLKPRPNAPIIPSSTVALSINGTTITSKIKEAIRNATNGKELRVRLQKKLNLPTEIFDSIDWHSHGLALSKMKTNDHTRITKYLHGWLPTLEQNHQYGFSTTSNCPICKEETETQSHIIRCKHPHSRLNLKLHFQQLKAFLRPFLPFHQIWSVMSSHINHTCLDGPEPSYNIINDSVGNLLQVAIDQQKAIGWSQLLYGRIAYSWGDLQERFYNKYYSEHTDEVRPKHHNCRCAKRAWAHRLEMNRRVPPISEQCD